MTAIDVHPAYVRDALVGPKPAPSAMPGAIGWFRANLFSSPFNAALTILAILLMAGVVPPLLRFLVIDATWAGVDREACLPSDARPEVGACWPFVRERFAY